MINIRNYTKTDYPMIRNWSEYSGEGVLPEAFIPEDSTFVLEYNNVPVFSVCVLLTNNCVSYLENFISDMNYKEKNRHELSDALLNHASNFAKEKGYKYLLIMCYRESLKKRYTGFARKTLDNMSSFVREL